jgi:hypothetical protein
MAMIATAEAAAAGLSQRLTPSRIGAAISGISSAVASGLATARAARPRSRISSDRSVT